MGVKWPLSGVIFDLDGTISDSMALQYAFHRHIAMHPRLGGMPSFPENNDEFWIAYNKAYDEGSLQGLYTRYGNITPENWSRLYPEIENLYSPFIKEFPNLHTVRVGDDDIADVIRTIWERGALSDARDTKLRLAVNTTKEKRNAQEILMRADLWQYFDTSVTYDDVIRRAAADFPETTGITDTKELRKLLPKNAIRAYEKPSPYSSGLTLERLGVPAQRTIVLEDTVAGVQAAKNVQTPQGPVDLYVVGVLWGYERDAEKLRRAGADELISTPSQIIDVIDRFGGFS